MRVQTPFTRRLFGVGRAELAKLSDRLGRCRSLSYGKKERNIKKKPPQNPQLYVIMSLSSEVSLFSRSELPPRFDDRSYTDSAPRTIGVSTSRVLDQDPLISNRQPSTWLLSQKFRGMLLD